ncbi:MAG: glycosyltransferase family 39 protein [Bryobacteraceae bacterium]|jgi:hypothetical protein
MSQVLHILFGAGFTVAVALAMGSILVRRLGSALYRVEAALFAFLAGSACLSLAVFALCLVHQARHGVFLWGGCATIAGALWSARKEPRRKDLPAVPMAWISVLWVVFSAFFLVYFFHALAPEASPDGMGYHLGNVSRLFRAHGFVWDYRSMYCYLSQGMELLYLVAFTFGRHSAAAMTHLAFLAALPLLLLCYGRRFGFPKVGVLAAIAVYTSPVFGMDGTSAYNDVAVATVIFAVFYLLQVWDDNNDNKLLILIGILTGFAYAIKYTVGFVAPFAIAFVWWRGRQRGQQIPAYKTWLALLVPAAALIAPWMIRNWIWVGNPLAPFFNRWFPNPYYHTGMEKIYLEQLRHYTDIKHFSQVFTQLTMRGGLVGGIIGPVFLLAPLGLLAARCRQGRRLLLAALVFAIPAYLNTGARFLIPCLPFVAMALGLGLANTRGALMALAVFEAIACWPSFLSTYCDPWAWRIGEIPIRAALRMEPEWPYLVHYNADINLRAPILQNVPPDGLIFSLSGKPEAYIDRNIVVSYESALGNLAYDVVMAPLDGYKPTQRLRFKILPEATRGVRVVQTATGKENWTVAEMRVYSQGRELPRAADWRLSAWPNAWEVQLAFDNSYVTRWSTWQSMSPGDKLQIDFPRPEMVDEVVLECAPSGEAHLQLELLNSHGRWIPMTDTPERNGVEAPLGLRRAATLELKARGIGFMLIDSDFFAKDMKMYKAYWGITELALVNGTYFYRID